VRRVLAILAVASAMLTTMSCGDSAPGSQRSITVFAAASLTDAFADVAQAFEDANPGVSVELNFAGSSSLREQILAGAPADVFASADTADMERLVAESAVADPEIFVTNGLRIAVPAGNPAAIDGLDDFAAADLLIGLCAAQVPCGELARRALEAAGVTPSLDTNEPDVRALLAKVEAGELDAGIVYATDVISAGAGVDGIDVPAAHGIVARYPISTVTGSGNPGAASAFVEFVLGADGRPILQDHGFGFPDDESLDEPEA
jgi:molybdate transport system substrate-binding protein